MKYFATFFAVIALLYASVMSLRVPPRELSWAVQAYVIAQCITHFFGLLGLQKRAADTDHYLAFFTACYAVTLVLGMVVAGRLLMPYEFGVTCLLVFVSVSFVGTLCARIIASLLRSGEIPFALYVVIIQAGVLLVCGLIALVSLVEHSSPAMSKAALALSLYWILHSAFSFAFALGILKRVEVWSVRNEYIPAMLVIIFFGWLGLSLSGLQLEAGRQAVSSDHVQVVEVAQ